MKVLVGFEAILQQVNRTIDPLNGRLPKDRPRPALQLLPRHSAPIAPRGHATSRTAALDRAQSSSEQRGIVNAIDDMRSLLDPSETQSSLPG